MRLIKEHNSKRKLASILTNSIFLCIGVLIIVVILQNYQVSRDVVMHEMERTKQQTVSLVQEIFNLRINSLEITQDSYSRSNTLAEVARSRDSEFLDRYVNSADQLSPKFAPDFRYIVVNNEIIWDDANLQFYGISHNQMDRMRRDIVTEGNWHISHTPSSLGLRYLAVRRTAIVDINTGEVVGHLHIGIVLNNNFSLINEFEASANADEVLLTVGSEVIASSNKVQSSKHITWLEESSKSLNDGRYMVAKTDLTINNVPTFISVYTIQDNEHVMSFVSSHYIWIFLTIAFVIGIAVYTRLWLGKRVSNELNSLMSFTDAAIKEKKVSEFKGSTIEEFDQIARSFQRSFRRLNEQEQQFTELFNFSLSPITLWDVNGELSRFNPAAERSFHQGRAQEQLVMSLQRHVKMCAQGATLTGINTTIANKTFRWNLSPITNDNRITHIMAQGQDITSFIEAEKQSEAAREQAEESARARADFLARMSHELRTPLNGILGVSQLLKDKMENEQDIEHMDILCNSGEHLLAVLNDILDFSKIEQGKFHIEKRAFRLVELTTTVDKIFKPLCDSKNVEFIVKTNIKDDVWVYSDHVRLNQIIFNLVSNAVKFTSEGRVQIILNAAINENECNLLIDVQDSGIGIEKKRLRDIFEPFVQAEATTTREYGGSGLGLAIVHSLVTIMEGEINVESEFSVGTQFSVTVPLQIGKEEMTSNRGLEVDPATLFDEQVHVLLVEDNHTNAFIAKAFCEKYGMKVSWVEDGINAIEMLKTDSTVSLVLMDNQLPNLGGIEATNIIRNELGLSVPIYACTADGMKETKKEFLRAGANYVIVKPIKESVLNKAFIYFKEHNYPFVEH